MNRAILFDVDGTLVDSNDAHARAWVDAFTEAGVAVDFNTVRRSIGMGGDKLMPAASGIDEESEPGSRISKRRGEIFKSRYLPTLKAFPGAADLVSAVTSAGFTAVAASSAKKDELHALLDLVGVRNLLDGATSSDDAEESKPDPDIIHAALRRAKAAPDQALMIGDTPYDIEAAARAGVSTVAFRCGGWGDAGLKDAIAIYDGPWDLLARLDAPPLGVRRRTG